MPAARRSPASPPRPWGPPDGARLRRVDDEDVRGRRGARRAPSRSPGAARCRRRRAPVSFGPRSSPRRCTARTMRSPLSVTIPGNTTSPTSPDRGRDDDLRQTGCAVEEGVRDIAGRDLRPEGEALVAAEPPAVWASPRTTRTSPSVIVGRSAASRLGRRPRCRPASAGVRPSGRPPPAARRRTATRDAPAAGTVRRRAGTARRASGRGCSGRRGSRPAAPVAAAGGARSAT